MEDTDLPPFVAAERDALLAEIYEVFPGGSRQGGVSWSESVVIDLYGSPEERAEARAKDRDTRWQDVLDDPNWNPDRGVGGWSFLDAIGFRYYLPAAMVLAVRQGWDVGILFYLNLPEGDLREWKHDKWSMLNLRQRLCVRRFLQYMGIVSAWRKAEDDEYGWFDALRSYWGKISDGAAEEAPASPSSGSSRKRRRSAQDANRF